MIFTIEQHVAGTIERQVDRLATEAADIRIAATRDMDLLQGRQGQFSLHRLMRADDQSFCADAQRFAINDSDNIRHQALFGTHVQRRGRPLFQDQVDGAFKLDHGDIGIDRSRFLQHFAARRVLHAEILGAQDIEGNTDQQDRQAEQRQGCFNQGTHENSLLFYYQFRSTAQLNCQLDHFIRTHAACSHSS